MTASGAIATPARSAVRTAWVALLACGVAAVADPDPAPAWERLEAGLELGRFAAPRPSPVGDSVIRVLRIDPRRFELRLLNAARADPVRSLTAREWCRTHDLVAAINSSMYQADHRTSVSLMRTRDYVNNPRLSKDRTVLAFGPRSSELPPVKLIDRDCEDFAAWSERYDTFVQSIRMISCDGRNVWQQQPRRWSTAAIGTDGADRVLFIHVRSPYSTHDLIEMLKKLPLDLRRAMYAEGGPEAQLYLRHGSREWEFVGSYETGFLETDANVGAWPVPNVLGIARR